MIRFSRSHDSVLATASWLLLASMLVVGCAMRTLSRDDPIPGNDRSFANTSRGCQVTHATASDGQAVRPPIVTRCVLPSYPQQVQRSSVGGVAVVEFLVDSGGRPDSSSIRVVRSSDFAFADAIGRSVLYLRFEPRQPGEIRPVLVRMQFAF